MKLAKIILPCLLAARAAWADDGIGTNSDAVGSVKDTLIQIEHDWGDAMVRADVAAFSRCVADQRVLTTSDGTIVTKAMAQAELREGALKIESFRLDDVWVRV
jgi:hypothetical protein